MHTLLNAILLLFLFHNCNSSKSLNKNSTLQTYSLKSVENVTYEAISRGYFEYIIISETEIQYSTDRNRKKFDVYKTLSSDWDSLLIKIGSIDLNRLYKLKAPTDKRLYDGAPIATLKVKKDSREYKSAAFDHGYPPKDIEEIIELILTMTERAKKH